LASVGDGMVVALFRDTGCRLQQTSRLKSRMDGKRLWHCCKQRKGFHRPSGKGSFSISSFSRCVSGIMYVAVLIARLVGVHAAAKSQVNLEVTSLNTNSERTKEQII